MPAIKDVISQLPTVCGHAHPAAACGSQRTTFVDWSSPSTVGSENKSPVLGFGQQALMPAEPSPQSLLQVLKRDGFHYASKTNIKNKLLNDW